MSDCVKCDGLGFVYVLPEYAARLFPEPAATLTDSPSEFAAREAAAEHARIGRAGAAQSVYPCKECNTALFLRWAGGHLRADHDVGSCDECSDQLPPVRRRAAKKRIAAGRGRRDLEEPDDEATAQPPMGDF